MQVQTHQQQSQPVRANRIPRISPLPTGRPRLSLTERLYRSIRRFQVRRQLTQLLSSLDALEQHMFHDDVRAAEHSRMGTTSPTLHARRAADAQVFAELARRRDSLQEELAELDQPL
ncbi:MAG: hypothetical protein O9341_09110 [Paucibacter sp.]|nr:hypothetical protein [Roseateles sp.]